MKNFEKNSTDPKIQTPVSFRKTSIDFQVAKTFAVFALLLVTMLMSSCDFIGGVFKTGMGVGIFIVVAIIAVVVALIMRSGKK